MTDDRRQDAADMVAAIAAEHAEPGRLVIEADEERLGRLHRQSYPVHRWVRWITRSAPVAAAIRAELERFGCVVTVTADGDQVTLRVDVTSADPDGLDPDERRIADRIADLPEEEPPEGWEDRAVERRRRKHDR